MGSAKVEDIYVGNHNCIQQLTLCRKLHNNSEEFEESKHYMPVFRLGDHVTVSLKEECELETGIVIAVNKLHILLICEEILIESLSACKAGDSGCGECCCKNFRSNHTSNL